MNSSNESFAASRPVAGALPASGLSICAPFPGMSEPWTEAKKAELKSVVADVLGWQVATPASAALATPIPAQAEPKEVTQEDPAETLKLVCDVFSIGSKARDRSTILANVENALRRSNCLWAVEHRFFMTSEPDEDDPEGEPFETCLLNWGDDPDQYVTRFGEALALATGAAEGAEPTADAVWGFEANKALTRLRFFRDLTERQRIDLFSQFKAIPAGAEDEVNSHTIEHTLFNIVWASPQRDSFSEAIDAARAAQKGQP